LVATKLLEIVNMKRMTSTD